MIDTPERSARPAARDRWTAPRLTVLPPLTGLTLATGNVGEGDNPGLFSFRPRSSDLG